MRRCKRLLKVLHTCIPSQSSTAGKPFPSLHFNLNIKRHHCTQLIPEKGLWPSLTHWVQGRDGCQPEGAGKGH